MVKREVTTGNLQSIATTLLSWATVLVAITLAYGRLTSKDELHDLQLQQIRLELNERKIAETNMNEKLGTVQADIRVIKQILEHRLPKPP
ncbi:hypothetical protein [Bosea sp. (in: a-proteobacteria)]|uniref:hypothetical protein n=1 Tax=Bosea sp. (in: a-proteobacteria) TaxID=1871050 RepID=UPI001ACF61D7|nr:hypothetical protein [Bosea sp. (in: a-proteobacteria)]MBN9438262.1 hypothetical protein [Bosea sp. (in: a-proteobacteria)]